MSSQNKPLVSSALNFMHQYELAKVDMAELEERLLAAGYIKTGPDEFTKTIEKTEDSVTRRMVCTKSLPHTVPKTDLNSHQSDRLRYMWDE